MAEREKKRSEDGEKAPLHSAKPPPSTMASINQTFLHDLERLLHEQIQAGQFTPALINARKALEIAIETKDPRLIEQFNEKISEIKKKLREQNNFRKKEQEIVERQIRTLEQIINIDSKVAPEVEDILAVDLLTDALVNSEDLLQNLSQILESHRVQIKHEGKSCAVFIKQSGAACQLDSTVNISQPDQRLPEFLFEHCVNNKLRDPIEEALIHDTLPYNFEITQILINDKEPIAPPQTSLTPEGLQVNWRLTDQIKNEKIDLKYYLRPRISRTIVIPFEREVKVIKTHSNINEAQAKEDEGIFNTALTFVNKFQNKLSGAVAEDIIPPFYNFEVEEVKTENFPTIKESSQNYVKWQFFEVPINQLSRHEYTLFELHRIEQLKMDAYKLLNLNIDQLDPAIRDQIKQKQDEARRFLEKFHIK